MCLSVCVWESVCVFVCVCVGCSELTNGAHGLRERGGCGRRSGRLIVLLWWFSVLVKSAEDFGVVLVAVVLYGIS